MFRLISIHFLFFFIAGIATLDAQTNTHNLFGVVTTDNKPAAKIELKLTLNKALVAQTITDSLGKYIFNNLQPNTYVVQVSNTNQSFPAKISEKGNAELNIQLKESSPKVDDVAIINTESLSSEGKKSKEYEPALSKVRSDEITYRGGNRGSRAASMAGSPIPQARSVNSVKNEPSYNTNTKSIVLDSSDALNNGESYATIVETPFKDAGKEAISTFSCDMDAAAYPNIRRMIQNAALPPHDAVRIEEMINYFRYENYVPAQGEQTLGVYGEMSQCPWNSGHRLAMIGIQAKKIDLAAAPPSNIVFLVDVSGSMNSENRLPLVKKSLKLLLRSLRPVDNIALVTYAGGVKEVLPPTSASKIITIETAIDLLVPGGGTAGASGIELAYNTALQNFNPKGNNRVVLCTDGDFNVGISSDEELEKLIEKKRKTGIYLSILGYGMGNYKDSKMEKLSNAGNGTHAYIDSEAEATRALVKEFGGAMYAVANDVKLQVVFNPEFVAKYRLIGYDHRILNKEDFDNDAKDAGEMGSDVQVTALYEIEYKRSVSISSLGQGLSQKQIPPPVMFKIRYKNNLNESSQKIEFNLYDENRSIQQTSPDFRFAAAVATWGLFLRDSKYKGSANPDLALSLAKTAPASFPDNQQYRTEFIQLVDQSKQIKK